MKVTTIENLGGTTTFHYGGEEFTVTGRNDYGVFTVSENGRQKMFTDKLEVLQDFIPSLQKAREARQYTEAFEEFALSRMIYLYMTLDTSEFFIKSRKEVELDFDANEGNEVKLIFRYGYHETGHFEVYTLNAALINVPFDEWDEYCKLRKQEQDAKESLQKAQNALAAQEKKYQEYLKLKEEFKDV